METNNAPRFPPSKAVVLAVEGEDEISLIDHLAKVHNWQDVEAYCFSDGDRKRTAGSRIPKRKLRRWLEGTFSQRGFHVKLLGVICDAESNKPAVESQLREDLTSAGFEVAAGAKNLSDRNSEGVRTSYLIMPDGEASGSLEHALVDACQLPKVRTAAEEYQVKVNRPEQSDAWRKKVVVHAMIAAGKKPQLTLGQSFDRSAHDDESLWNFEAPSLKVVTDFVEALRAAL